jgi:hypothetical protein
VAVKHARDFVDEPLAVGTFDEQELLWHERECTKYGWVFQQAHY